MSPEEKAALLAPRATSYACPRSTCREFLHLRSNDQGRELWCPKCGFVIGLTADALIPELRKGNRESRNARSSWMLMAILITVLIGLVIFWWVR
jgi:hypothetical protein